MAVAAGRGQLAEAGASNSSSQALSAVLDQKVLWAFTLAGSPSQGDAPFQQVLGEGLGALPRGSSEQLVKSLYGSGLARQLLWATLGCMSAPDCLVRNK